MHRNIDTIWFCLRLGVVGSVLYILVLIFGVTKVVLGIIGVAWLLWWLYKPNYP